MFTSTTSRGPCVAEQGCEVPCHYPLTGYRSRTVEESGKRRIVFKAKDGYEDMVVKVPCGRCLGCRLEYARQWAVRCVHEAQCHEENSFLTLTYNDQNLPEDRCVHKRDLQLFFKRLRKELGIKVRYYACGEYGEEKKRPHYHVLLFGYDFPDKLPWMRTKESLLYRSAQLEKVWTDGYALIGDVTYESAAYVARYVVKKWKGETDNDEYRRKYEYIDPVTGEIKMLTPEFCLMSRREGIGAEWYRRYKGDTEKDFVTINGRKQKLPEFYDRLLEKENPTELEKRKAKRRNAIDEGEQSTLRQWAKDDCAKARLKLLKRDYEG